MQILQELKGALDTRDVGVILRANHSCISCRGVEDLGNSTLTSVFWGQIENNPNLIAVLLANDCS
ncbi:MAG: GTP cyclohydrolase I [Flavobacteriales bacterium]|nr:GTP cyclohydrolase I [Flavobacteriales bacterium]